MSVEKTLKQQARGILAKDNWPKSVTGFLCVCLVLAIIYSMVEVASIFITEDIMSNPVNIVIIVAAALLGGVAFILLSPVYTGYIRFIANCKNKKTGDIQDVFYYLKKCRYIDTVQLNLGLFVRYAMLFIVCALPAVACLILMKVLPDFELIFKITAVWTGIIAVAAYLLVSRFWVMTQLLYVADFDYIKESELYRASRYIVKKNLGKVISLYFSFILYLLLCFFVIPVVFVYPYFKHTTMLAYAYMYEIEMADPQSPYFKENKTAQPATAESEVADNTENADTVAQPLPEKEKTEGITVESAETSNEKTEENTAEFDNN
ncbi:MAG: hypothetical protein UD936_01790 [Acutalibacteraceae bacterium]|nr:hypothetical protein [Acutalibacteraceae bacterium]